MIHSVVVGGGIAGIATAALLAREGHRVTLFERSERLGGRAGAVEVDGFRFETGPSWYLMPRVFDHFFELLGTSTQEQLNLTMLDPGYQIFSEPVPGEPVHAPLTIPFGAARVAETFERLEPGSTAVLQNYLASAEKATRLAERAFLYNPFTRLRSLLTGDVLRATPQLVALLGSSLERYAARRFSHPVLRQVLGYPAVFLGTDPRKAPALYHLMSALDLKEGVQYPMGGFRALVDSLTRLAMDAGVNVVTEAEVTAIVTRTHRHRFAATGVRWRDRNGHEHAEDSDLVVSAADLHHTETMLLEPRAQSYPESWWGRRESGPGAIIALLGVSGPLPQLDHHSLFFTSDWHDNFDAIFGSDQQIPDPASIYVCKPSATDPNVAPAGHENLFVLIPVPALPELGAGGTSGGGDVAIERTVDTAVDQISRWADIPDLRTRIVTRHTLGPADFVRSYHSWRGGMLGPSHVLRQSAMFRPQNQSRRVAGLYYAGATTAPGVGVPMCLISAELVLKRIRGDHSSGPTLPRQTQAALAKAP